MCDAQKAPAPSAETERAVEVARSLPAQAYMLRWLAKEETSLYGEVEGRDFDVLHSAMLVTITGSVTGPRGGYAVVSLTPFGRLVALSLKGEG